MQHIDFHMDKCDPDHAPYRGQGVFTDMPDALKRTHAHLRVMELRRAGYQPGTLTEQEVYNSFPPGTPLFFRWGR